MADKNDNFPSPKDVSNRLGYNDFSQNSPHHFGTLDQHVQAVIDALPGDSSDMLKMAALFHDIGKYETVGINQKTGYMQFVGHAEKSVEILEKNNLLPDDQKTADYIKELIRLHDTKYSKMGKCQDMLNNHPDGFAKDLVLLEYADVMGQSDFNRANKLEEVKTFAENLIKYGSPEKTEGLNDVISMTERAIKEARDKEVKEKREKNETKVIKHTAKNDKEVVYSDLYFSIPMKKIGMLDYKYENNGIILEYFKDGFGFNADIKLTHVEIDGKEYGKDYDGEIILSEEEKEFILDEINKVEGRTKEPYTEEITPSQKVWLARTASNQDIYIDQQTYEHMKAHPDVDIAHTVEAIGKINDYNEQFRIGSVDLGRTIGKDRCIEVTDENKDSVKMAIRKGRDGQTPVLFEKDGFEPAYTSKITLGMCKDDDGKHTIFTSFYGDLAPKEPWDKSLKGNPDKQAEAKDFWDNHALVVTEDMVESLDLNKENFEQSGSYGDAMRDALDSEMISNAAINKNGITH